ncbi:phage holin [Levilactobacillus sp. HBUAS70063]|uniref:phage holin n=1 Tax=Levilactobacillus sp. HBUAS70063 TaxID=3109359 RepID=UPI0031332991
MKNFISKIDPKGAAELAVLFLAIINQFLSMKGQGPLPIKSDDLNYWVSTGFTGAVAIWNALSHSGVTTSLSQKTNVSSVDASNTLDLAQKLASAAVSEQSVNSGLTKAERKKAGIQQVLNGLADIGLSLDSKTVAGIVERAYQLYRASGGTSLDVTETPAPVEDEDERVSDDE